MAETRYSDKYAQVRQINIHNRSVCYWRNNLSLKNFREEGGFYVFEDSGSYKGLSVSMKISVRKEGMKKLFKRKEKCHVEFWGSPKHMGIRVRMKTDCFPGKCCGKTDIIEYRFEMSGTMRGLSYVNEAELRVGRRDDQSDRNRSVTSGFGKEKKSNEKKDKRQIGRAPLPVSAHNG